MKSKKLFALVAVIAFAFLYLLMLALFTIGVVITSISDFLTEVSQNPAILLGPEYIFMTIAMIILSVLWLFALIKLFSSVEDILSHKFEEGKELKSINNEMKYLEIFIQTAEKEFMKRRISQETFNQIQVLAGKKMVELKSKRKKMSKDSYENTD